MIDGSLYLIFVLTYRQFHISVVIAVLSSSVLCIRKEEWFDTEMCALVLDASTIAWSMEFRLELTCPAPGGVCP